MFFVADEETSNKHGIQFLLNRHGDIFQKNNFIVVPDAGVPDGTRIEVVEKSLFWGEAQREYAAHATPADAPVVLALNVHWDGRETSERVDLLLLPHCGQGLYHEETGAFATCASFAIKDVCRVKAKPKGIGGGTVAAFFRRHGFGAVVWSKIDEVAHQPNEYTILDNMIGDAKVFAHLFVQE